MYKNVLIHVHNFINLIYDGHSRYLSDRHGRYLSDRHGRYLSDGHGAEDVEEDEAAVGVIVAHQVPVRDALDPRDRRERKLRHDATVKTASTTHEMGVNGSFTTTRLSKLRQQQCAYTGYI